MKKILGLDLGTTSIGWALVNEAEDKDERSAIINLGVRVNPLTTDESQNFEKGKAIETNAVRRDKRGARRNLQRYKLRRSALISLLKEHGFITDESILSEQGNASTFETYRLRAKAVTEEITLEQFARVLLMINKKRGYKSRGKRSIFTCVFKFKKGRGYVWQTFSEDISYYKVELLQEDGTYKEIQGRQPVPDA